jgi:glycosyltransferase involved in cell wall biosynthesis
MTVLNSSPRFSPNNQQRIPEKVQHSAPVLKNKDIVVVGLQPWYFPMGCNAKDIALLLAEHNRVMYVNIPVKRKIFLTNSDPKFTPHIDALKKKQELIRPIGPNIWEFYPDCVIDSANWLPFTGLFQIVNYFNTRRYAREIKKACKQLGFRDIIVFNDNDPYNGFYLKELLKPSLYIYYLRDFLQGFDYWRRHTAVIEPQLIRKSDVVVANSTYFAEYSSTLNPTSWYIGQGCNLEAFDASQDRPVPDDLQSIGRPIIGYIGALDSSRLDHDILRSIATENPGWNLVMVGPEDEKFLQSDLHDIPNIHFKGRKPFDQLAAYVKAFDVCINPQFNNTITRGNYPLKIDEYLAMGKPVVATRTVAMKIFEDHTYLADQPGEYTGLIKKALAANSQEKANERIRFAQSHSWENSVDELYKAIESTGKFTTES